MIKNLPIEQIIPKRLRTLNNKKLILLHKLVHQEYKKAKSENRSIEPYTNAHRFIVDELVSRNILHDTPMLGIPDVGSKQITEDVIMKWKEWPVKVHDLNTPLKRMQARDDLRLLAAAWARLKAGKEIRSEEGKGEPLTLKQVKESAANVLESLIRQDAIELHPEKWKETSKSLMEAAIRIVRSRGIEVPIKKSKSMESWDQRKLKGIVIVPDYVSVVGSSSRSGIKEAEDIDILIRDDKDAPHYWKENMYLILRHILDPEKTGKNLHLIFNPQGPHEGKYIPIFDLVLRDSPEDVKLIKSASAMPGWRYYVSEAPEGQRIDLGPGDARALGFIGMGKDGDVQIEHNLEEIPWPLEDNSVAVIRANHVLEHLSDPTTNMLEIYRVLMPGGIAIITVPSTVGEGAFAHPGHKSYWNKLSFSFWIYPELAHTVEGQTDPLSIFDLEYISDRQAEFIGGGRGNYVDVILRKIVIDSEDLRFMKSYSRAKCMECNRPPEVEILWAEGMAHAWFCKKHFKEWKIAIEAENRAQGFDPDEVSAMRELKWGVASKKWSEPITKKEAEEYLRAHQITKRTLKPITRFQAPRPAQRGRGHTDAYAVDDIWGWAEPKIKDPDDGVTIEQKFNGFRSIAQYNGKRVSIRFESGEEKYPILVKADPSLKKLKQLPSFILDVNIGVVENNRIWPRPKLMTLQSMSPKIPPNAYIKITAFDLLYWDDTSINEQPFIERRAFLEKAKATLARAGVDISSNRRVKTKQDILNALRSTKFGSAPMIEGIVLKQNSWKYEPGPSTTGIVKIKHTLEVKAKVIEKKILANGKKSYRGGLLLGKMLDRIENLKVYNNRPYVNMGFSFNTDLNAKLGDTITFQVDEIIYNEQTKHMAWLGAVALDVDPTRGPYVARQVLDMARRAGVLQHTKKISKQMTTADIPLTIETGKPIQIWMPKRKLPKWLRELMKAKEDSEGETRGERASRFFAANWYDMLPTSGKGKFSYQHHWPSLIKEETKLSDIELMEQTKHAAHGDLRLEADDELWGWSVFIGKMKDNINLPNRDKLIDFDKLGKKKLQCQPKLAQPKQWLNVGVKKPYIAGPGEAGVIGKDKYAKFFSLDHGTYRLGVCREHSFEVFLNGKKLKGRMVVGYAPVGEGGRKWLIDFPDNQTPYTQQHPLKSILKEVKKKHQPYLVWADPDHKPVFIDIKKDADKILTNIEQGMDDWEALRIIKQLGLDIETGSLYAEIYKAVAEKRFTYTVVYKASKSITEPIKDAHREFATADELQEALWDYVRLGDRDIYVQHGMVEGIGFKKAGEWVELATIPYEFEAEFKLPGQPIRKSKIPAGSIVMGVIWLPWSWKLVKKGKIRGFSFGGLAGRITV